MDALLFNDVVETLNKVRRASNAKTKGATFTRSFKQWLKQGDDAFPVLRLVLSSCDKRAFELKEKKLASFLAKVFRDERDDYIEAVGKQDLTTASRTLAEKVGEYRIDDDPAEVLTVGQVNEALDEISKGGTTSTDPDAKLKKMEFLVRNCSEDELEWIFNVIMKNTEAALNSSANSILDWISPDARTKWVSTLSLKDVAELLSSPPTASSAQPTQDDVDQATMPEQTADEHLFVMWKPMLLSRQKKGDWFAMIEKYGGSQFFMQTKYDGENVLLHKRGNEYRWFTRNGKDFSLDYGNRSTSSDKLSQRIHPMFKETCKSAIFNCEIMLWDKVNKVLCRHQDSSKTSDNAVVSFRHIKKTDNQQLTCVIFDLLYYNGDAYFAAPLEQRLEMLNLVALKKQSKDTMFIADNVEGNSKQDIQTFFRKAMADKEEGVVVKRRDSLYKKGERNVLNGWFKLKPSASSDCDLDLALISLHPGEGLYGRMLFRFAAKDDSYPDVYIPCLGVSNGLDDGVRELIRSECGQLTSEPPEELRMPNGQKPRSIPAGRGGYVNFEKWPVITIRSNGVRNGKLVDATMTRLRDDKSVDEIDTIETFHEYEKKVTECQLKDESAGGDDEKEDGDRVKKPTRVTRKAIEATHVSPVKSKRQKIISQLTDVEVAVLQGTSEKLRKQCEEILAHFGAKVVKNAGPDTSLIIATAPKANYPTTSKAIKNDQCTVLKSSWVLRCDEEDDVKPWNSDEVFHQVLETFRVRSY